MEPTASPPSPPSPIPDHRLSKRQKTKIACNECRQAKLKCTSDQAPCSRCMRLRLNCTFDPGFKRVHRQSKMAELENHVMQLQNLVETRKQPATSPPAASPTSNSTWAVGQLHSESSNINNINYGMHTVQSQLAASARPSSQSSRGEVQANRSLGPIKLALPQIESLFKTFFEHYHHFLPFLEPSRTPHEYYDSSPLLFWSIVAVAARQYRADVTLLTRLSPVLTDLLWTVIASSNMSTAHVQALLLLSYWQLPNIHLWTDRSLILTNIALTSAMHLGMHRPGREDEYTKVAIDMRGAGLLERTRTWVACVCLSQSLSADFGHAPTVPLMDSTVQRTCKADIGAQIPTELRSNLLIQMCNYRAFQRLSQNEDHPFGLPPESQRNAVLTDIEKDFDMLQIQLGDTLSFMNTIRLQSAKLYAQCIYFLDGIPSDFRKVGVLRAYSTASTLISTVISDDKSHELLSHSPLPTWRILYCAALVIFRVLNSTWGRDLERANGRVLYNAAAFSMRQLSVQHNEKDIPIRTAERLSLLWKSGENDLELQNQEPRLQVQSRMGSSLVYDSVMLQRKYFANENSGSGDPDLSSLGAAEPRVDLPSNLHPNTNDFMQTSFWNMPELGQLDGFQNWESGLASPGMGYMRNFGYPDIYE